jgi:hypothetical protein
MLAKSPEKGDHPQPPEKNYKTVVCSFIVERARAFEKGRFRHNVMIKNSAIITRRFLCLES